jgi:uncharacterized protein (DUF2236 family)
VDDLADRNAVHGLYGPSSEAWRLHREAILLVGAGPRALLMQIAHPLIAEGVDQHSDVRRDPWHRLERTLRSYLTIIFGSTPRARAEIRRLNALHRGINGPIRDDAARVAFGSSYAARDPELLLWVHATLIESVRFTYEAWIEPLTADDRARLYLETRPIGRAFGIPDHLLPPDVGAFDAYYDAMCSPGGPVHPTATARELARFVISPRLGPLIPPLGWLPPVTYDWLFWPSLALLPPRLRQEFGIDWGARQALVAAWLTTGFRMWRPLLPTRLRFFPIAVRADERIKGRPG